MERGLDDLEDEGTKKVTYSEWAVPTINVIKNYWEVVNCDDLKMEISPQLIAYE